MTGRGPDDTTPSATDGDGVRIVRESAPGRRRPIVLLLTLALIGVAIGYFAWWSPLSQRAAGKPAAAGSAVPPAPAAQDAPVVSAREPPPQTAGPAPAPLAQTNPADWRTGDANDLATYVSPTDPEPTAAELIKALRDSGDKGGIAAFNPPGTSPPLKGLAVPEDFVLPPGYVRHHQVTDAGEPIEAILMFSPDYVFRDAAGNVIPIPEDRVVPPEMAPPGLPIREIEIPPPPE